MPTIEETRKELSDAHKLLVQQVNYTAKYCMGCRSGEKLSSQIQSTNQAWPPNVDSLLAADSLIYRLAALKWHISLLRNIQGQESKNLMDAHGTHGPSPQEVNNSLSRMGFVFDDIVFNSVSIFDYLAKFICAVHFPGKDGARRDWRGLVKPKNRLKLLDDELSDKVNTINYSWFRGLDKLRSHIIHNMVEVGGVELETNELETGTEFYFDFFMPERATNDLSVFASGDKFSIEPGATLIALQSFARVSEVLSCISKIEYQCLKNPSSLDCISKPLDPSRP